LVVVVVFVYPDGQQGRLVARASAHVLWVEGGVLLAHERWLEDVAAQAVGEEAALVQVHLLPGRLEVQRHCAHTHGTYEHT